MKIFLKVSASSVNNKIKNEWVSKDDTAMVPLLLLILYGDIVLMLLLSGAVQE